VVSVNSAVNLTNNVKLTVGKYIEIAGRELNIYIAIADSDDVPSIFGRVKGLDLFDAKFIGGERINLSWNE